MAKLGAPMGNKNALGRGIASAGQAARGAVGGLFASGYGGRKDQARDAGAAGSRARARGTVAGQTARGMIGGGLKGAILGAGVGVIAGMNGIGDTSGMMNAKIGGAVGGMIGASWRGSSRYNNAKSNIGQGFQGKSEYQKAFGKNSKKR